MKGLGICLLFLASPFLYHGIIHPFKMPPSLPQIQSEAQWDTGFFRNEKEIREILEGPFTYLASGNQFHVFENGGYVLKLFRYNYSPFAFIHKMKRLYHTFLNKKLKDDFYLKTRKTFHAAFLGATKGKEVTEVLFAHLNLSQNLFPKADFKVGKKTYSLPLDRYRFILQKKAVPLKTVMLTEQKCDSLLAIWEKRKSLNIKNSDPNIRGNIGFIDERAVEIDFGNYRSCFDEKELESELSEKKRRLSLQLKEKLQ